MALARVLGFVWVRQAAMVAQGARLGASGHLQVEWSARSLYDWRNPYVNSEKMASLVVVPSSATAGSRSKSTFHRVISTLRLISAREYERLRS